MAWIHDLYETYQNCLPAIGERESDGSVLLPVGHSTANAQVEMVLDVEGNFILARTVDKSDGVTIIPVTEDSATRSSGIAPHPLCDKLCYVAGDYDVFTGNNKANYFEQYITALKDWAESEYATESLQAVYIYLSKGCVIRDLSQAGILKLTDAGMLGPEKVEAIAQGDVFIRFIVERYHGDPRTYTKEVWLDKKLYTSFEKYYRNKIGEKERRICYVTGDETAISEKHPGKIRNSGDKSKLISSNDSSGYTFRGRFETAAQAVSLGFETSQKAHNALRWLIQRQGYRNGSASIVTWAVNGSKVPSPCMPTQDVFMERLNGIPDEVDTAKSYAERLNRAIAGYKADLKTETPVVVMAVDTADGSFQGRLAITFYSRLRGSKFLERIEDWHLHCSWIHLKKFEDTYRWFVAAPPPDEIAHAAYGIEQNGLLKVDDKLRKQTIERILPCIVDGRAFPADILYAAVRNVSRPMAFGGYNWKRILNTTCAMIKKYKHEKGVEYSMELNEENRDRSYLFGRLLAIAEYYEELTYDRDDKKRMTNAERYWNAFSKRPARTWQVIRARLIPYLMKLYPGARQNMKSLMTGIESMFSADDFSDKPLAPDFIIGYSNQMENLKSKQRENKQKNMEEEVYE